MSRYGDIYRATLLDETDRGDARILANLRANPAIEFVDHRSAQQAGLRELLPEPGPELTDEGTRWAYYPWRRAVVGLLGPRSFRRLRLDRNRNKLTAAEQERLADVVVGVVGLSVGHAVALALALEGDYGELRLADFDALELSNLNRVPATVFDLGVSKAVVAARRVAEIDPYLTVTTWPNGVDANSIAEFLDGLDVVVEECDSLDIKVLLRDEARRRRIPVVMETSDRGLLDVERFDLEPQRPLFHGLLGDVDPRTLAGLSSRDKIPRVLGILEAGELSPRMAASLVEVGESISTWPQLGGDVLLGGASVAAAVRRLALGQRLDSGRCRIDIEEHLDDLGKSAASAESGTASEWEPASCCGADSGVTLSDEVEAVLHAAVRAPSGGNSQPWRITATPRSLSLSLDTERTSTMDLHYRGSYVAIGAALHNARVAAAAKGLLGPVRFHDGGHADPVVTMNFGTGDDDALARQYEHMLRRGANRKAGVPQPLGDAATNRLVDAAAHEGARLHLVTEPADLTAAADILAESDRIRYLTPTLHREMIDELKWTPRDSVDTGIDVRSLALDAAELSTLELVRRPDVMAQLSEWDAGVALGRLTSDRVTSSSALAAITVSGCTSRDFVRGGAALQSVWICAQEHGLAVQPVSPVFLFATEAEDLEELSPRFSTSLAKLQCAFLDVVGVTSDETLAMVLRLSHASAESVRSARRRNTVRRTP